MAEDPLKEATARLFLAIPLYEIFPQEIEDVLRSLCRDIPGVRWIEPRQIHLTLHFFGSVPTKEIELIHLFSQKIAVLFSPFKLSLDRIGGFPSLEKPGIVWLGVEEPSGRILSLQKAIQGEVQTLGFRIEERPFQPHATIGRVRRKRTALGLFLTKVRPNLPTSFKIADHFVLYQSRNLPEGVRYEILETYPFSKKT